MNKFNKGDRVRVYVGHAKITGTVEQIWGDILEISPNDLDETVQAHYKQCRKLIIKKPRIFYLNKIHLDLFLQHAPVGLDHEYICVREVRNKK